MRVSLTFGPVLTVIFAVTLALKLIGIEPVASLSWWLITAPLWGGFALILGLIVLINLSWK